MAIEQLGFDAPRAGWHELWEGPLRYRATYDRGKFGPGHTFEQFNEYGQDRAKAGPIYRVSLDPADGAIVIEWLVSATRSGRSPIVRYYDGGPHRAQYDRLRDDVVLRHQHFSHLPIEVRDRAIGAYATAVSIREWLQQEFFNAVDLGQCEIWARVGSKVASFQRIPSDIFRAYQIKSWGFGKSGAAWAELDGAEPLFAIHVAPSEDQDVIAQSVSSLVQPLPQALPAVGFERSELTQTARAPAVKAGRPPSADEILAKADEMKARGLQGRTIAKNMRHEPGFENVATTEVRDLIKGRYKGGRPKRKPAY